MPEIVAALLREIAWPFALVLAWVARTIRPPLP